MFKILDEEKPEYLTVTFDVHAPTFRHEMFADYKGTRKPMGRGTASAGARDQGCSACDAYRSD